MPKPSVCVSCTTHNGITSTTNSKMPKWLSKTNYVTQFKRKTPLVVFKQKNVSKLLTLDLSVLLKTVKHRPQFVLVWGTHPIDQSQRLTGAKTAYGDFQNHQVIKITPNTSKVFVYLQCPRPYVAQTITEQQKRSYPRHIHFCFGAHGQWFSKNYTKNMYCNVHLQDFMDLRRMSNTHVINALSKHSFDTFHIPGSVNLPATTKLRGSKLRQWFMKHRKSKKIREIPIVVYCAHKTCQAGHRLTQILVDQGFVNVYHYLGGNREFKQVMKRL